MTRAEVVQAVSSKLAISFTQIMTHCFREMRQRSSDFNEDRISSLPDAILIHILSLLPMLDAINTILIKRFHHIWSLIQTLMFDQCMFPGHNCVYYCQSNDADYDERFLSFIRSVLLRNKSPTIDKFCLNFHFSLFHTTRQRVTRRAADVWQYQRLWKEKSMADEIGAWIQFTLNKKLKVLDLSFCAHGTYEPQAYYELPNFVLRSPHLVEIRLAYCKVNTRKKSELRSLTTLSLDNVLLMDESLDNVLSGCPLLDELTLWFCQGYRQVVLVNSSLKTLVLGIRCFGTRIHVSCPTLQSLQMSGDVEVLDFTNLASIVQVSVNRMKNFDFTEYNYYQEMEILLHAVTGAKSVKLCSWFSLLFSAWQFTNQPSPTFRCKSLHLQLDLTKWHLPGILNLLKHSPWLENLIIEITNYHNYSSLKVTSSWIHSYDFDEDVYWNMVDTCSVQCLTSGLKTVKVGGLVMEKVEVIQFIEFLLRSCMVLEKMVVDVEKQRWLYSPICLVPNTIDEVEDRLMKAPKASPSAVLMFY